MFNLKKYNTIVFDCDGVILDSNKMKSNAFSKALEGESDILIKEFIDYHRKNGGISRFAKFEYFYSVLKKKENFNKELLYAIEKYSKICYKGMLNCNEIPGVIDFLENLKKMNIDLYVVSGGEQCEVNNVLIERGMSIFFKKIYGSPESKIKHLKKIRIDNALYFGDSYIDYVVAKEFNMDFIYISGASEWTEGIEFCKKNKIKVFEDFNEVKNNLCEVVC
jgi:phosphoglycolate phosphatase-like HAD superfamily hydrolase